MKRSQLVVQFPSCIDFSADIVGEKAHSLFAMVNAGFPVPHGAVLTANFFEPWFDKVRRLPTWEALAQAKTERWPELCEVLQKHGVTLPFSDLQRSALIELRQALNNLDPYSTVAVRSSSPDEDLASASFAGLYESVLGVSIDELDDAVRRCFVSSLAERVLTYKKTNGMDFLSPAIAVIVQQQVNSEIAGVGFSLNPITNDYDEIAIDANWGLGVSVVSGSVAPDHFVVNKISHEVVEKRLGGKATSIWLAAGGGTRTQTDCRSAEWTLSALQLRGLTGLISRVELLYGKPMDVEWAFAEGQYFILQARPITRYVPLASSMLTKAGERRRLYGDAALSKGMTTNAPISPLECDWGTAFLGSVMRDSCGIEPTPKDGLVFYAGNRLYMNFSNLFWFSSPAKMAKATEPNDPVMARILEGVDATKYRAARRPGWISLRMLWCIVKLLWWLNRPFWNVLWIFVAPHKAHRSYRRNAAEYELELRDNADFGLTLSAFRETYGTLMWRRGFMHSMPALGASLMAIAMAKLLAGKKHENKELAQAFEVGSSDNVVVQMGIAMNRLAHQLNASDFLDVDLLAERIQDREMPSEFLSAWDDFNSTYGWRGPLEMDVASPRYADRPQLALRQMSMMDCGEAGFKPEKAHKQLVAERQRAGKTLMARFGWLRKSLLNRTTVVIELFGGSRDMPKHQMVLFGYAVRRKALMEGERLVQEGRLDSENDIFNLTAADVDAADVDPSLDLRQRGNDRTDFSRGLVSHVSEFPQVIDSRGRILRPPPTDEKPGQLSGLAVSPGVVRGPVKILRNPHDQPICKGDVLVAYTTDPGWTPLFVNASAIVLEIGGILQHGAVVAREFGKPCVSGVDRAVSRLKDGQLVEVNGDEGVIRILHSQADM